MNHPPTHSRPTPENFESTHIAISQVGSQAEFGTLIEPYRRELQIYCYRLLGSPLDAEDMVQETMLRAWRHRATFLQPISFRAWLYKIATNVCLNELQKRPRRMLTLGEQPATDSGELMAAPIEEPIWLEPIPDEWLTDPSENPEARYGQHESISLAFMAALQWLPARQRAALILRDVLDWPASETATLLGLTVSAVNSALHRARMTLAGYYPENNPELTPAHSNNPATRQLLEHYVRAWETADITGLVSLLRTDVTLTMPPIPSWYRGSAAVGGLLAAGVFTGNRSAGEWRLVPTQANRQPAFAIYRRAEAGAAFHAFALQVLTIDPISGHIAALINFLDPALLTCFGLPVVLPAD